MAQDTLDVRCWLYDVSELYDSAVFDAAMVYLPWEERRARVGRYRFERDRCLCLGAGLLAAHALRDAGAQDLSMAFGEYGKPHLAHEPHLHFGLSHSGRYALCAVASEPVGADVEERLEYEPVLARYSLGDAELEWALGQDDAGWAFTRLWVRKESYLKLLGTGLVDDLHAVDVRPHVSPAVSQVWFWEHERDGYAMALCLRREATVELHIAPPGFWRTSIAT